MHIFVPFVPTKLFSAPAGSLIYLARPEGRGLALVVKPKSASSKGVVLAILEPSAFNASVPCHMQLERDLDGLMVPSGWEIELVGGSETWPRNRSYSVAAGALHLDDAGVHLHLDNHPANPMQSELSVNLGTLEFSDIAQNATPFATWRIWRNADDRVRQASPLFVFTATENR